jgi:acetyl-CoA decarbonylase/synthase complex subunit beta
VEGFGIVMRGYRDLTVNGLAFSTMADSTAGGRQVDGFHGISLEYMRSPKFMAGDGGYSRVVWLPSDLKEQLRPFIPDTIFDKVATEKDVKTVDELRQFLERMEHPVTGRWKEALEPSAAPVNETGRTVLAASELPVLAGGFKIIFKNARITADRVTIVPVRQKKRDEGH